MVNLLSFGAADTRLTLFNLEQICPCGIAVYVFGACAVRIMHRIKMVHVNDCTASLVGFEKSLNPKQSRYMFSSGVKEEFHHQN